MSEDFLQYVWQYKQFSMNSLTTDSGLEIEIIDSGKKNDNAGPDFFNAKIKIGDTLWAGNVEIHKKSSDWYNHNHHLDDSYSTVILHVVDNIDKDIFRKNGEIIPQFKLDIPDYIVENHKNILLSEKWIKCESLISQLPKEFFKFYISKLVTERYSRKAQLIIDSLSENKNNWENTFYIYLARNFGMSINTRS